MGNFYKIGNNIYRKIKSEPSKAVICTPDTEVDRVVDITDSMEVISRQTAKQEINRQWDQHEDTWVFNGKKYRANKTLIDLGDLYCERKTWNSNNEEYNSWSFKGEYGKHVFTNKSEDFRTKEVRDYKSTYWLGQFQGKLVWYTPYHYCPQAYAFQFEGINVEPKNTIGFIPMKHIKPIYCLTDKKWI